MLVYYSADIDEYLLSILLGPYCLAGWAYCVFSCREVCMQARAAVFKMLHASLLLTLALVSCLPNLTFYLLLYHTNNVKKKIQSSYNNNASQSDITLCLALKIYWRTSVFTNILNYYNTTGRHQLSRCLWRDCWFWEWTEQGECML